MSTGILLASAQDLREYGALADVPAHFFSTFDEALEMTASPNGDDGLDAMLKRFEFVGIDVELLLIRPDDSPDVKRYRRNLAQKLCGRCVAGLWTLHEPRWEGETHWTLNKDELSRMGESAVSFDCRTATPDDLAVMIKPFGARMTVVPCVEGARLVLDWIDGNSMRRPVEAGVRIAMTLGLECSGNRILSRPIRQDPASVRRATMRSILEMVHYEAEVDRLERLRQARDAVRAGMQRDTQHEESFELVIIATRPMRVSDESALNNWFRADANASSSSRAWLMQDTLRAASDSQTLLASKFVWPDAVSFLLARLRLAGPPQIRPSGLFAWRAIGFGPSTNAQELEKLRESMLQRVLESVDSEAPLPSIGETGAYKPILKSSFHGEEEFDPGSWLEAGNMRRDQVLGIKTVWRRDLEGSLAQRTHAAFGAAEWLNNYRKEGAKLARQRARLSAADGQGSGAPIGSQDPETAYMQAFWRRAHRNPGELMRLANGVGFRMTMPLKERVSRHAEEWRSQVLGRRRQIGLERELLLQCAEEIDCARGFHMAMKWRIMVGAAMAVFAVYLSLVLFSVLLSISAGTLGTSLLVIVGALVGAAAGVVIPHELEARRGKQAMDTLRLAARQLGRNHTQAVRHTHDFVVEGNRLRQDLRRAAVQRRTELLAERAWTIVKRTRETISNEIAKRRLLDQPTALQGGAERLAREDRRDWREHAIVRPVSACIQTEEGRSDRNQMVVQMRDRFLELWRTRLDEEDRYMTGFIRRQLLHRLVLELSQDIADQILTRLLDIVECDYARHPAIHAGVTVGMTTESRSRDAAQTWGQHVSARIGADWSAQAMLSATYEDDGNRKTGAWKFFARRGCAIASSVLRELRARRLEQILVHEASERPLGLFGFVFEEVPIRLQALGSADEDAVVAGGAG